MKNNQWPNALIAVVVVLCSLVLLAALATAVGAFSGSAAGPTLTIDFKDVTGLKPHSQVRYAGATIGAIEDLRYLTAEERGASQDSAYAVRATIRLKENSPPLRQDVRAAIGAESLLGEKFIDLTPGRPDSPALSADAILLANSDDPVDQINELLAQIRADYPNLMRPITNGLSRVDSLIEQSTLLLTNVDSVVLSAGKTVAALERDYRESLAPSLKQFMESGNATADQLAETSAALPRLIQKSDLLLTELNELIHSNTNEITRSIRELRVIAQNLKVSTTYLKALTGRLGEKPNRILFGRKKMELPSEGEILQSDEPILIQLPKD